jgi:hypothetical protein
MATESMLRERQHRQQWMAQLTQEVRTRSTDPSHRPAWPDVRDLYAEGYIPYQAAAKYLEAHHLGIGS